jgi:hypothetical protein
MTVMGICDQRERPAPWWFVWAVVAAITVSFPLVSQPGSGIVISDFEVSDWFRSVRVLWKAVAPDGAEGFFDIYRSEQEEGPYTLVQEIRLGDKKFYNAIKKAYIFYDKQLKVGGRYFYKLVLRGTDDVFGPSQGLASGAPPGT